MLRTDPPGVYPGPLEQVGQAGYDVQGLLGPGDQVPLEFSSQSLPGSLQTPFPYVQEFPAEIFWKSENWSSNFLEVRKLDQNFSGSQKRPAVILARFSCCQNSFCQLMCIIDNSNHLSCCVYERHLFTVLGTIFYYYVLPSNPLLELIELHKIWRKKHKLGGVL